MKLVATVAGITRSTFLVPLSSHGEELGVWLLQ